MESITVTLVTNKQNEIKRFINTFYSTNTPISSKTFRWSGTFVSFLDTIEILSALIDNGEKYSIEVFVQFDKYTTIKITASNLETYIKFAIYQNIQKNRLLTADFYFYTIGKLCFPLYKK